MNKYKKAFQQSAYNTDWKCPAPEEIQCGMLYTFNYNPSTQPAMNELTGFYDWIEHISKLITGLNNCDIQMVPELSRRGRFHYHGFIIIHNPLKFFIYDVPKLLSDGVGEIDTIGDLCEWSQYVYKQHNLMVQLTREHGLPYQLDSQRFKMINKKTAEFQ